MKCKKLTPISIFTQKLNFKGTREKKKVCRYQNVLSCITTPA